MSKRIMAAVLLCSAWQASANDNFQLLFNEYLAQGFEYSHAQQLAATGAHGAWDQAYAAQLADTLAQGYERTHAQQLTTAAIHEPVDEVYRSLLLARLNQGYERTFAGQLASVDYSEQVQFAEN